jgi:hypothetical protein
MLLVLEQMRLKEEQHEGLIYSFYITTMSLFQEINAKEAYSINGGKLLPQVIKFPFTIKYPIRRPRCPIYFF